MRIQYISLIAFTYFTLISFLSCSDEVATIEEEAEAETEETYTDTDFEAIDWTAKTHSKSSDPDFTEVFDNSEVKRLDIVITADRWQKMLDNMTEIYGTFGASSNGPDNGPGGPPGPGTHTTDEDPIFVPAEVFYQGKQWYRVGLRFKGNSSLKSSWNAGILKLSLKLDFDEFEDYYPQIDDQRFYGFKKLSLKNNFDDKSFLREKVAAEIFERAGLAVSHTAFYKLYIDHGNGPQYFGLYTLVEEVDNTLIDTQFSSDDGNLYKPENTGASFMDGSFNETDFEKKTNEDENDWSDIRALFRVLHSDLKNQNPDSWRTELEAIFDTDVFLRYLAVNAVIQNWDTYGRMTHNYYLYNNPDNNKLTWIPWDNNEALQEGKMDGALALNFSNIQQGSWPLIEYLYNDPVYKAKYDAYLEETIKGPFAIEAIQTIYENYASQIEPYAIEEVSGYTFLNYPGDFEQAFTDLNQHCISRASAVEAYLD